MSQAFPGRMVAFAALAALAFGVQVAAAAPAAIHNRYALILTDPAVGDRFASRAELSSDAAAGYRQTLETAQASVRQELAARNLRVTGSVTMLVNAVFVAAPPERAAELKTIPGVLGVVPLRRTHPLLNAATAILDGPQAWNLFGGLTKAGAGIKIGILDTGIDQTHPSLQDSSLSIPSGFPKCNVMSDCTNFTNSKVIVARSYVTLDAAGTNPANPALDSQPDDYSARDRVGHGTGVATAAAGNVSTLAVSINGMAPKAWIGNYKIAGSPGVNDGAGDDAFIAALDDAVADGMDIVTTSFGGTAFTGPTDTGATCGQPAGVPCDLLAYDFEQAAAKGVVVLAAAGNEGEGGPYGTGVYPAFNTISTPADAPSVIAVGAVSNAHGFNPDVEVQAAGAPSNLNSITAAFTDAYIPYGAYTAPLIDITQIGDPTGLACNALPAFSLIGSFALIKRGTCTFATKMSVAVGADALGVVFYDDIAESLFNPTGLGANFTQPVLFIGLSDGQNLRSYIDSNPGTPVTINPSATVYSISGSPVLAGYSSLGPGLGTNGIKPDVLAVGAGSNNYDLIYVGAQNFDPLGEVFSSVRYIAAAGTSFATPLTAGSAALVKQEHAGYTGQQVKSAIVNTAAQSVTTDDGGFSDTPQAVNILQTGSGLVAADLAIQTNVTIVPATVSFGGFASGGVASGSQQLTVTNTGTVAESLAFSVVSTNGAPGATVAVNPTSLFLVAGATGTVSVSLTGTVPAGGLYYGSINVTGGAVPLHVPWMFLSPFGLSGTVSLTAVSGDGDSAITGAPIPDQQVAFQLLDQNGAPVTGAPVTFTRDGASVPLTLSGVSSVTDNYGFAYANVAIGAQTGTYLVDASGGGQFYTFTGTVYAAPTVFAKGVVDNAGYVQPIAPGSYVSIFGTNLSEVTDYNYSRNRLPLSIDNVTVTFDAPANGSLPAISVPGYLNFISPGQINIQIPWELQGYTSAQMKVTLFESDYGNLVTVPLVVVAPQIFEVSAGASATLDSNFQLVTSSNPAARGSVVEIYCNGLGPVTNQPASGNPALANPLSNTINVPTVTIGGVAATVAFSGLAPGYPGLNQINLLVPANLTPGPQTLVITSANATSQPSTMWVK
jgi:minor extracellular serine protease Vpr